MVPSSHALPLTLALGLTAAMGLAGCMGGTGTDLELKLGVMMPLTGALNALGPDMERGAKLAIKHVNEADAGIHIEAFYQDDKTTDTTAAPNTFNLLVGKGATAIVGPCCSGVTASLLDLAMENEVVVASPSATSPALVDRENGGFFWRVPPSDALQGKVLARLVADSNVSEVNLIHLNNPYGNGLARVFTETFEDEGGEVGVDAKYDEQATNWASQVDEVCTVPPPEAIVMVSYVDDGAGILKEMQAKGCLPLVQVFASEGVCCSDGADGLPQKAGKDVAGNWLAAGMHGSKPHSEAEDLADFNALFEEEYDHEPNLYAAESYDAVMYVALAALAAGSTEGADIAEHLLDVANGGHKTSDFAEAAGRIADGEDVDYAGQAHDFDYGPKHEPTEGVYAYWRIGDDGKFEVHTTGVEA